LDIELRKKAIQRYLQGEKPKSIYTDLKRSKKWFFKWLRRYQTGQEHWYQDQSRAPLKSPRRICETEKQRIIEVRKKLESEPFAQTGASAIKWELRKSGFSFPSDRTINRVLKREGLVKKKTNYITKGVEYPYFTEALDFNNIHQADLVGPRYIKGDGRFYSLNVMDLFSHRVYIESQRTKEDHQVAASLMRCWKALGLPDFLQIDNELSFRGSNKYPRSFGVVIRLCLHYGIQPVFIPIGEPWRNGSIERFNDTYSKKFFRRQWFSSYAHLKRQSKNFQTFHNRHHRYSCLRGKTPNEFTRSYGFEPITLGPNTKLPDLDEIADGNVILIRFIRSDRNLDIFGEKFKVSKDLVYSYVKVVIVTQIHQLQIYLANDLAETFDYQLTI